MRFENGTIYQCVGFVKTFACRKGKDAPYGLKMLHFPNLLRIIPALDINTDISAEPAHWQIVPFGN